LIGLVAGAILRAQQPEFRASAPMVSVHATVVDRTGHVVGNLTRDDFEVYDNGRLQPLTVFDAGQRPISIVVMLDRSSSMDANAPRVEAAARAFVATLLPEDRVRIGTFGDEVRLLPESFTSDAATLYGIIDRSSGTGGATPLWLATKRGLDALAAEQGQRVVLVFTDGRDTPAFSENVTFDQILSRVRREETMVYAVGLAYRCGSSTAPRRTPYGGGSRWYQFGGRVPGQQPRPLFPRPPVGIPFPGRGIPPRNPVPMPTPTTRAAGDDDTCRETAPDPDLRELAIAGGGGYFELRSTDDLTSTFERVARELHSQYLLGFAPPELDGALHTLDVRVKRSDLTVRARRTYVAAEPARPVALVPSRLP
jgi:VWFA-related protein